MTLYEVFELLVIFWKSSRIGKAQSTKERRIRIAPRINFNVGSRSRKIISIIALTGIPQSIPMEIIRGFRRAIPKLTRKLNTEIS